MDDIASVDDDSVDFWDWVRKQNQDVHQKINKYAQSFADEAVRLYGKCSYSIYRLSPGVVAGLNGRACIHGTITPSSDEICILLTLFQKEYRFQ